MIEVYRKRNAEFDMWGKLFGFPVEFINLQHGECAEFINKARNDHNTIIHDWPDNDPLTDLDDFAAKVAALDLVVSIDHFNGVRLNRP